MTEDEAADSFDLPDECEADRVVIYESDGISPYYAVPFDLRRVHEDGTKWYDEPDDHEVTDEYFQAVKERAQIDIDDVKLRREEIETYGVL